ncbi:MAG: tRNA pseudouridine(38-40) synthase TruA [Syntrophobacterales bacterium]|nr:tRNA pseudouridine(38-40) synthase TruA [Syntrophobacterales bacterium]
MKNLKMVLEYDGTAYYGWQRQVGVRTIQETVEGRILLMTRERVTLIGSGRTDAGVHALRQVANFRTATHLSEETLLRGLNSLLPRDIVVKEITEVDEEFHSQYDAKSKVYEYRIFNSPTRTALLRNYCWHVYGHLDLEAMKEAAGMLPGRRDFSSFCASGHESKSMVREVFDCRLESDCKGMVFFSVEADGFLRYMVRNIVGTLVDVGKSKLSPEGFRQVMKAKDRRKAGVTAPPNGLFLVDVKYA